MPITLKDNRHLEVRDAALAAKPEYRQRRRMLIALAVLLVALIVVLVRDRQMWFFSAPTAESDSSEPAATPATASNFRPTQAGAAASREGLPHPPTVMPGKAEGKSTKTSAPAPAPGAPAAASPLISATDRAVLPPLQVEVVAGNQRRSLAAANSSVKVDMEPEAPGVPSSASASQPGQPVDSSGAHVLLSHDTSERVSRPVEPNYPLLAKQMKVQGAVVLQALIDKAGGIQDLRVISGPTILAAAAREAVKQWHFKPYYQNGNPVETEARITVNFTISTY
jgi:protein TonB